MQVTREVISDLAASKYQMVEWRSVLDARLKFGRACQGNITVMCWVERRFRAVGVWFLFFSTGGGVTVSAAVLSSWYAQIFPL